MTEPLWSDDRIANEWNSCDLDVAWDPFASMRKMRDEYETALAAANALTADARVVALERLVVSLRAASYSHLFEDAERDEMLLRQSGSHQ